MYVNGALWSKVSWVSRQDAFTFFVHCLYKYFTILDARQRCLLKSFWFDSRNDKPYMYSTRRVYSMYTVTFMRHCCSFILSWIRNHRVVLKVKKKKTKNSVSQCLFREKWFQQSPNFLLKYNKKKQCKLEKKRRRLDKQTLF